MVKVLTSHAKIWHPEIVTADIIKEYQSNGTVTIDLNMEGPCADTIGLYKILDYLCAQFNFDPTCITICTANFEETHPLYNIKKTNQHWIFSTCHAFTKQTFISEKNIDAKLFGCLYNVPSWDRLCLLAYVTQHAQHECVVHLNGSWEGHNYNSYYLDTVTDHCPEEFFNIAQLLKTNITPAASDLHTGKPVTAESMLKILPLYNNFLIDIVAETYHEGLSFFITEKTLRPMLALTPFIIQGSQGYLSTLKSDYGFKTFNNWWDESYDNYQNYDRIKRIYEVISYIDSKTTVELFDMYNDMLPTLTHNHNRLLEINAEQ